MGYIFGQINYGAVIVAAIIYWLLGMLCHTVIIGKKWGVEVKKLGINITRPTSNQLIEKSIWTFVSNLLVCFGIAVVVHLAGIHTFGIGLGLGILLALCFAVAILAPSCFWLGKSLKLSF